MTQHDVTVAEIQALTPAQRRCLDSVAMNGPAGTGRKTIESLLAKGFLVPVERVLRYSDGMNVTITNYDVPTAVHIAWAATCSVEWGDRPDEGDQ